MLYDENEYIGGLRSYSDSYVRGLLTQVSNLKSKLGKVGEVAIDAIAHVGSYNRHSREREAKDMVREALK